MPIDFTNPDYLLLGSSKQRLVYQALHESKLLHHLSGYNPILAGTIPIGIDVEGSDLDIICEVYDFDEFAQLLRAKFSCQEGFSLRSTSAYDLGAVVCKFIYDGFEVEIFGQALPTKQQNAYRHMLIEYKVLQKYGDSAREEIRRLKRQGMKTEPAFAKYLGLLGDPYIALLEYGQNHLN